MSAWQGVDRMRMKKGLPRRIRVFISHSAEDSVLASVFIELVRCVFGIKQAQIRCTSVDGYRLPAGVNTDEQLRREVLECDLLVGILTDASIGSLYVSFEMGARWGARKAMLPLLAGGLQFDRLQGPLRNLHALTCVSISQAEELVRQLSLHLGEPKIEHGPYEEIIGRLVEACSHPAVQSPEQRNSTDHAAAQQAREGARVMPLDDADARNILEDWIAEEVLPNEGPLMIRFTDVASTTGLPVSIVQQRLPELLGRVPVIEIRNVGASTVSAFRAPYAR